MNVAICDDIASERQHLSGLLRVVASSKGIIVDVTEYDDAKKLLFKLEDGNPNIFDIVFLDVLMPGVNGINVGQSIRSKGYTGIIVYASRSSEYAIEAFDVDAFNYILKDDGKNNDRMQKVISGALEKAQKNNQRLLMVSNIHERRNIPIDSISYFEVYGRVVTVHYGTSQTFEFLSSMDKVEAQMMGYGFMRIQRSYLVNVAAVASYNSKKVALWDKVELPIGRARWSDVREVLKNQCGNSDENQAEDQKDRKRGEGK